MSSNWISDAEAALTSGTASDSADIVDIHAPAVLDADGARALIAPFLAGFMWAAVVFRELQTHSSLDPMALLFRVLALSLTLRAMRVLFGGRLTDKRGLAELLMRWRGSLALAPLTAAAE